MGALAAAYGVEAVVTILAAVGLAAWLRRRTKVGYGLVGVGALVFIVSQIVHLPLNWALGHVLPNAPELLPISAAALGLSAGLCEELARYVTIRWVRRDVRHTDRALMLGAGHGGIEALLVGTFAAIMLVNVAALSRSEVALLGGLSPEDRLVAVAQIHQLQQLPTLVPLVGALERLLVLPFHLAATLMVTAAVARSRPRWLVGAIALHASLDAGTAWLTWRVGLYPAELWVGAIAALSLAILWSLGRALRRPPTERDEPEPRGTPIELAKVSKTYGGTVRALRDATLVLEPGTRTCLLGPNGAGKTTSIRLLTGGLAPSAGHAWLFGVGSGDPAFLEAKRRLGLVPQQPGMYDDLTVRAWLELVRDLYERGDVDAVATELGIEPLIDRPMGKLSGGQKRRVAIAAAVLAEPELLVLDEPSAGLDPVAAREVTDFLHAISPSRTILLCTHDLEEAEELCEDVVVMRGGRVLVHEAIEDLRARVPPQLELRISSDVEAARAILEELGLAPRDADGMLLVHVSRPDVEAPALLRGLLERGVDVVECRVLRASLEDLFLDIVGAAEEPEPEPEGAEPLEEPLQPAVPLRELFGPATRRLLRKEWRQLRASGSAFWTALLVPLLFLVLMPQAVVWTGLAARGEAPDQGLPQFGLFADVAGDPGRLAIAMLPLFVTVAALAAPAALITHSIVSERETRTLELLAALPVRIQQVIVAKVGCVVLFTSVTCGACVLAVVIELMALGIADVGESVAVFVLLAAALGYATALSLLVAILAKDFRTANNLAGFLIAPSILVVIAVTVAIPGVVLRPLVVALLFAFAALAVGRVALRSATFEKLST